MFCELEVYSKVIWLYIYIYWRRQWHPTPVLLPRKSHGRRSLVGCSPWSREESDTTEQLHFHFHFHALEKEMATHSSVLAWRIPGTWEPGGLPSLGSHRVGHDWSNLAAAYIYIYSSSECLTYYYLCSSCVYICIFQYYTNSAFLNPSIFDGLPW